jgi:hypothetical protein
MSRNMGAADVRPANMRRPEMHPTAAACAEAYSAAVAAKPAAMSAEAYSATVAAKPAAMSAKAREVSATTVPTATAAMSPAAMSPAATAPATAGVCFEREKRHDDEQHRGNASAGCQYKLHGAAELGAPDHCGRLSLAISPRTKSF